MKPKLVYPESIADLWGYPDTISPKRPETKYLFLAIAGEAHACLKSADWEDRIRRIENILSVIKWRIRTHWEERHKSELDQLVRKKGKEVESHVG
jgi:hypothetical protein